MRVFAFLLVSVFIIPGLGLADPPKYPWLGDRPGIKTAGTIETRFKAPPGFERTAPARDGFARWLGNLPLRPEGWKVHLVDGRVKGYQAGRAAVIALDVIRYQECADAVIRLRAEYKWSQGRRKGLCFNFTSGDPCCWAKWRQGYRPVIKGSKVSWVKRGGAKGGREEFRAYLRTVFTYAGTISVHRDLAKVDRAGLRAGDVIITPGSPGHAVLIVDEAQGPGGEKAFLLGQSYMPAQEFHVLKNPQAKKTWGDASICWYRLPATGPVETPEWNFSKPAFRRWQD